MRLPAVAIAAAFAVGIALGLHPVVARNASSHVLLSSFFIFISALLLAGIILFGHPSQELLERLENAGVRILRTDRDGAVDVLTDGTRLEITCFVACPSAADAATSVLAKAPSQKQD